ncbi:MAG: MOSC domain-containing protein [Ferruginibacter sp.]
MIQVSGIYIYPIKSLGGISLASAAISSRGLQYDRRYMLVDDHNRFLTQREYPQMALLKTSIEKDRLIVSHKQHVDNIIELPLELPAGDTIVVNVWEDNCLAYLAADHINQWFSRQLGIACRAVFMPDDTERIVDQRYAKTENDITSFADAYPILMISEASLEDLNSRLEVPVPMDRFRPNIVISGCIAFEEDSMKHFSIKGADFYGVKLCGRCVVTTTDQETAARSKEPLKTLAGYRTINKKVCFGQNVIGGEGAIISIGDTLSILESGILINP